MIKDSSEFVVFQEMLVYYSKELVSNIGADNFAEWGGGGYTTVCCPVVSFFVVSCG